jgi:hypothetical protein
MLAVLTTSRDFALRDPRLKRTSAHVQLLGRSARGYVKVKDVDGQADGRARVWYIHDTGDVALHRRARQQEVDLVVAVAEAAEILDNTCSTVNTVRTRPVSYNSLYRTNSYGRTSRKRISYSAGLPEKYLANWGDAQMYHIEEKQVTYAA